ncbi:MAG TPA: EF-hand domain-containing protein [Ideonella sp.]|uniref:EF-hand domain-containing protein n=1 Tax=Ideonella sp. TaxID=1929293 RepID=UPI002E340866|nr:EF-hand domain-containing protein [Ideonella sp.]HEX5687676.1 EF-hand domain-containing protein [Ideonella sp.]
MKRVVRGGLIAAALLAGVAAGAATPVLRDPALPEALRHTRPAPPSEGVVLQAQVEAKLRGRFEAADASGQGHISRAQAEAAGLGFVARHFNAIDSGGHGSVSWAQVQAYIAQRAAAR